MRPPTRGQKPLNPEGGEAPSIRIKAPPAELAAVRELAKAKGTTVAALTRARWKDTPGLPAPLVRALITEWRKACAADTGESRFSLADEELARWISPPLRPVLTACLALEKPGE